MRNGRLKAVLVGVLVAGLVLGPVQAVRACGPPNRNTQLCPTCLPDPSCTSKAGNGSVDPVTGKSYFSHGLPGGLQLTYHGENRQSGANLATGWEHTSAVRLEKSADNNHVYLWPNADRRFDFAYDAGTSSWIARGDSNNALRMPWSIDSGTTPQNLATTDITVYYDSGRDRVTYMFHKFDGQADPPDGRMKSKSSGGETESYTFSGGKVAETVDARGRVTTYQYSGNTLTRIIESNPGYTASALDNLHGRQTQFVYSGGKVFKVKVGMPKTVNADPDESDAFHWRTTLYRYEGDQLAAVVYPDQYSSDLDTAPLSTVKEKAGLFYDYEDTGAKRVIEEISSGCGSCSVGMRFEYPATLDDLMPGGSAPAGRNAPYKQINTKHPVLDVLGGDVTWVISEKLQVNVNRQEVFRWTRIDADTARLERTTYTSDRGLREKQYVYDASSGVESAVLQSVARNTYDANYRLTRVEVSPDDSNWIKQIEYAYTNQSFPDLVTQETRYVDDAGQQSRVTDFTHDAYGRLTKTEHPTVTVNLDMAGGQSYRPTEDTEYWGASDSRVKSVTDSTGIKTSYFYADNDGLDNDGDSSTDEADEGFELTRVVRSSQDGGLELETRYAYTVVGGVWRQTTVTIDPDGLNRTTTFAYSGESGAWGNVTTTTTAIGNQTVNTYDAGDRVLTSESRQSDGQGGYVTLAKSAYTYDKFGNVLTTTQDVTANLAYSTKNEFDVAGRLRKVSERITDLGTENEEVTGNVTYYNYVEATRLQKEIKRAARDNTPVTVATYDYDFAERMVSSKDAINNETVYVFDWRGRMTDVTPPAGARTRYTFNNMGQQVEVRQYDGDPDQGGTLMAHSKAYFDEAGRVYQTQIVNPENSNYAITTNYYTDKAGRVCRVKDPANHQMDTTYDPAGRAYKTEDHLGNVTLARFNADGETARTAVKHKLSATPTWRTELAFQYFDNDGRLKTTANWGTNTPATFVLKESPADWGDEVTPSEPASSDSDKIVSKFTYDGLGRTTQVTDPEGRVTETSYDKLSRVTAVAEDKNGKNRTTTYVYDQYDETEEAYFDQITADNGGETKYFYADPKDAVRVTKVVYPDSGEVVMTYDNNGAGATRQDQRDWKTTFTRDALGRVTQETVTQEGATAITGTKNVRYTYDALSRLLTIEDDNGQVDGGNPDYDFTKVEYVYDWGDTSTDQTVEEKQYFNGSAARTATSTITADGVRSALQFPNGRTIGFTHDALHRLAAVTESGSTIADYTYKGLYLQDRGVGNNAGSRVVKLTFKDQNDLDGYDEWGRILWMRHYKVSGGTDVVKLAYGYSYASDRNYQEDLVNATSDELYGYDTLHRLTSFKRGDLNANKDAIASPAREQGWTLDNLGNWSNVTSHTNGNLVRPYEDRTHNTVNEITQIDPLNIPPDPDAYNPVHDDAGNLTSVPSTDGSPNHKFVYDYRNRLTQVKTQADANIARYYYDGFNRRVMKDLDSGTDILYLYDGWQVVEERELDGQDWEARRQFVYGGTYIDEPLIMDRDTDADGDCTDSGGSTRYFYAQQANFNVLAVLKDNGDGTATLVEAVTYDPYGEATVTLQGGQSASGNPYLFQGRRWDPEADLYYFRNRSLSPRLGRFVQRDPVRYARGMNLYETAGAAPHQIADPTGLWGRDVHHGLTLELAKKAGIACPEKVAAGAIAPDLDERAATEAALDAVGEVFGAMIFSLGEEDYETSKIVYEKLAEAQRRWNLAVEWHFPMNAQGIVVPGAEQARAKVEAGTQGCDFKLFSEGLHVLQDSWAHQGKPYVGGLGHSRGAEWVAGRMESTWEIDVRYNHFGIWQHRRWVPGHWKRLSGFEAARSHSADDASIWPEDARNTGMATYKWLVEFKSKCPNCCPSDVAGGKPGPTSSGPASPEPEVQRFLLQKYPGANKVK